MRPPEAEAAEILARLSARDPAAPADLVELCLEPLIAALRRAFPHLLDPTLADDAAIDALLEFVKQPERFDPSRGSLWTFLQMAARRDLQNSLQSDLRRLAHVTQVPDVELWASSRNSESGLEQMVLQKLHPDGLPDHVSLTEVLDQVRILFSDPLERSVLRLVLSGAFRTEEYVDAIGLHNLPAVEQRRRVKQAKDRIQLRLKRLGARLNG